MAGTNTEQPANKAEQKKNIPVKASKSKHLTPKSQVQTPKSQVKAPVKTEKKVNEKIEKEIDKKIDKKVSAPEKKPKIKKDSAKAYGKSMHVSTKVAVAICRFIKNKTPKQAIEDLEEVVMLKKPVPMKGEIPHRKGKIMSGRFPKKAAESFLIIVKNLVSNADQNDMEAPVIVEAIANKAQRPYGKGGRWKRKRTHVTLIVREKKVNKQNKNKK